MTDCTKIGDKKAKIARERMIEYGNKLYEYANVVSLTNDRAFFDQLIHFGGILLDLAQHTISDENLELSISLTPFITKIENLPMIEDVIANHDDESAYSVPLNVLDCILFIAYIQDGSLTDGFIFDKFKELYVDIINELI